jgi:hypothetical protein
MDVGMGPVMAVGGYALYRVKNFGSPFGDALVPGAVLDDDGVPEGGLGVELALVLAPMLAGLGSICGVGFADEEEDKEGGELDVDPK